MKFIYTRVYIYPHSSYFMQEVKKFLELLGLERVESDVYIVALSLGTVPASIIANRLKLPRSSTRYTCEQLVKKWLMLLTQKGNTKYFTPENPTKLYSLVIAEQEILERKREWLADAVKELQKVYSPIVTLPKVTFYEGKENVVNVLLNLLKEPTDVVSFWARDYYLQVAPELFSAFRKKAKFWYTNAKVIRANKYRGKYNNIETQKIKTWYFKYIDELKVDIQMTKDKLSFFSIEPEGAVGIVIQHKKIVEAMRGIFDEIWNRVEGE